MDSDDQHLILQELFIGQREVSKKLDSLIDCMGKHVEKDEHEFGKIHSRLATLDAKVGGHAKQWGAVSTIITSILSAAGISYFLGGRPH